jgi:hypothetical protein
MKKKILSLTISCMFLFSLIPVQVSAEEEQGEAIEGQESWRSKHAYQQLQRCATLDDALRFLSMRYVIAQLLGGEVETSDKEPENPGDWYKDEVFKGWGWNDKKSSIKISEKERDTATRHWRIRDVNPSKAVPTEAIKKVLYEKDIYTDRNTLEVMIQDVNWRLDNGKWYYAADATFYDLFGISLWDLKGLIEDAQKAVNNAKAKNEANAGEVRELEQALERSKAATDELINTGKDICIDLGEKGIASLVKELSKLANQILGAKFIMQGAKAGGTLLTELVPILSTIVDIAIHAEKNWREDKALKQKSEAIQKWEHIQLGLGDYDYTVRHTDQDAWDRYYENALESFGGVWVSTREEGRAKDNANKDIKDNIEGALNDANQNEKICWHFRKASSIHPRPLKDSGLLWDPERVEIEGPLMRGEPYPKII